MLSEIRSEIVDGGTEKPEVFFHIIDFSLPIRTSAVPFPNATDSAPKLHHAIEDY